MKKNNKKNTNNQSMKNQYIKYNKVTQNLLRELNKKPEEPNQELDQSIPPQSNYNNELKSLLIIKNYAQKTKHSKNTENI